MSFNSTNLMLLFKQTEWILTGSDLVYKMSTPRRYCQLTWQIRQIEPPQIIFSFQTGRNGLVVKDLSTMKKWSLRLIAISRSSTVLTIDLLLLGKVYRVKRRLRWEIKVFFSKFFGFSFLGRVLLGLPSYHEGQHVFWVWRKTAKMIGSAIDWCNHDIKKYVAFLLRRAM